MAQKSIINKTRVKINTKNTSRVNVLVLAPKIFFRNVPNKRNKTRAARSQVDYSYVGNWGPEKKGKINSSGSWEKKIGAEGDMRQENKTARLCFVNVFRS